MNECGSMESGVGRFVDLPEKIMNKILCSLNAMDLAQPMLVSKQIYHLCMFVPVLWVNNCRYTCDADSLNSYMLSVGTYLSQRCKTRKNVRRLNMTWKWHFVEEETQNTKKRKKKEKGVHNSQVAELTSSTRELSVVVTPSISISLLFHQSISHRSLWHSSLILGPI